jgi:DNA helicase-2/ATP-dependent DNA helicase PcrA
MEATDPNSLPWTRDVRGTQVIRLITEDCRSLRVAAGPGTGKTFGLRKRVLRLLHPDGLGIDPQRVLVCAFNRVIAADLKKEIGAELEPYGLDPPVISTLHGLCATIASETPRFLLPHEQEAMLYDIRCKHPDLDAAFGGSQAGAMRALREHEAGLGNHPGLATAVRTWLANHHADLVGDLPRRVATRLEGGEFEDKRFDHVLIDEFQDLTNTEARLAIGLRADDGCVLALGDKKQSIYAFRGNEDRGLDALPDYVAEEVIDLQMDECQRCREEVVQVANEVMAIYGEPLQSVRGPGAQLHRVHFKTPVDEHRQLAQEIVDNFQARPDDKHLVLVTRRKWGYDLRNEILKIAPELRAQTVFAEDVLETWSAREAFVFLSILAAPEDSVAVRDWLSYKEPDAEGRGWKAPKRNAVAYAALEQAQGVLGREDALTLAEREASELTGGGKTYLLGRAKRLRQLIDGLPAIEEPAEIVEYVLDPDRWITEKEARPELARDDIERLRLAANEILEETSDATLADLVQRLRYRIATREPLGEAEEADIQIVTLWGAKGLTADFVYLVGMCDEALPGPYDPESTGLTEGDHLQEQLRLLYVSLTRAKKALVLSRPKKIKRGEVAALGLRRRQQGTPYYQELQQCRFLDQLAPNTLPVSAKGENWPGVDLDALPDE